MKTLVITHGYLGNSPSYMRILKLLADHYRLVLFDNTCWGLNTRDDETSSVMNDVLGAETWLRDFMTRTFDALAADLPDKVYLMGHSFGGYLMSILASNRIDKVEALCLISPLVNSYNPDDYDPYKFQHD